MTRLLRLCAPLLFFAGCGTTAVGGGPGSVTDDAGGAVDLGGDAQSTRPDLTQSAGDDGTPKRIACTNNFGNALAATHGRLDGFLVSTVPVGQRGCNGDAHHIHLQIQMNGAVYDVAVTMQDNNGGNVLFTERDLPLPDGAWSEGWHPADALDYVSLGLHAGDFTAMAESALAQTVLGELQTANHISVFATGYGPTGVHDVHRKGSGQDGAIIIRPLSSPPHLLLFHFANQSF